MNSPLYDEGAHLARFDDRRLVERCLNGDARAFDAIFDRHASRVYNLLRRLCGGEVLAEDLTQETFVTAYRSLGQWHGRGELSAWLCGIAARLYANHRRRTTSSFELQDEESIPAELDGDPLQLCTQAESVRRIDTAIMALPEFYREAFLLVKVEGLSYREAAGMLQIPLGTLQSRLWKAVRLLQVALAEHEPGLVDSAIAESKA